MPFLDTLRSAIGAPYAPPLDALLPSSDAIFNGLPFTDLGANATNTAPGYRGPMIEGGDGRKPNEVAGVWTPRGLRAVEVSDGAVNLVSNDPDDWTPLRYTVTAGEARETTDTDTRSVRYSIAATTTCLSVQVKLTPVGRRYVQIERSGSLSARYDLSGSGSVTRTVGAVTADIRPDGDGYICQFQTSVATAAGNLQIRGFDDDGETNVYAGDVTKGFDYEPLAVVDATSAYPPFAAGSGAGSSYGGDILTATQALPTEWTAAIPLRLYGWDGAAKGPSGFFATAASFGSGFNSLRLQVQPSTALQLGHGGGTRITRTRNPVDGLSVVFVSVDASNIYMQVDDGTEGAFAITSLDADSALTIGTGAPGQTDRHIHAITGCYFFEKHLSDDLRSAVRADILSEFAAIQPTAGAA